MKLQFHLQIKKKKHTQNKKFGGGRTTLYIAFEGSWRLSRTHYEDGQAHLKAYKLVTWKTRH
jgi:hypothetical protein